jgi:hypothetical protein
MGFTSFVSIRMVTVYDNISLEKLGVKYFMLYAVLGFFALCAVSLSVNVNNLISYREILKWFCIVLVFVLAVYVVSGLFLWGYIYSSLPCSFLLYYLKGFNKKANKFFLDGF